MSRDKFGGPPPMAPQMNVDLSKAEDVICEKCGNYTFEQVMLMKRISALVSPTGKEAIVPIPTFCATRVDLSISNSFQFFQREWKSNRQRKHQRSRF